MTVQVENGEVLLSAVNAEQERRSSIRARLIRYRIQELGGALIERDRIKLALQLLEGTEFVVLPAAVLVGMGAVQ